MTYEQFSAKYRHRLYGLLAESWGDRTRPRNELGAVVENQFRAVSELLKEMYMEFQPKAAVNGTPAPTARDVKRT